MRGFFVFAAALLALAANLPSDDTRADGERVEPAARGVSIDTTAVLGGGGGI